MSFTRIPDLPQGGPPSHQINVNTDLLVLEQDITRKISPLSFLENSIPQLDVTTLASQTSLLTLSDNGITNNISPYDLLTQSIPNLTLTDSITSTDLIPLTHASLTKNITVQNLLAYLKGSGNNSPPITECFYVGKHGTDTIAVGEESTRGRNEEVPFLTIKRAAKAVADDKAILGNENKPYTIFVKSGEYYEENPIYLAPGTSLIGDNLRRLSIYPNNPTYDILWLNSACYVWGFTFRGHKDPSAATAFPLSQPTKNNNLTQYNIAYNTAGYEIEELTSKPNIRVSPYVQGCTSYATSTDMSKYGADDAGAGMRIDGSLVDGFLRSMVLDSFTQVNQGGKGIHIINHGYAQLVSIFTVATKEGVLCESGGSCSVSTSNCTFGLSGLIARGKSSQPILEGSFTMSPTNDPNNSPYGYTVGGSLFTINNIESTAITEYTITSQSISIDNSLNNFNEIILSQDNTPATTPAGNISDSSYSIASNKIKAAKSQIQQEVINYALANYPAAMSNNPTLTAYCYRDTGYIVDAIAADISNNANHRSVEVGNFYYKGVTLNVTVPYGDLILPSEQLIPTINSIGHIADYINSNILTTPDCSARQSDVTARVNNVVYPLQNSGSLQAYSPAGSPTQTDIDIANLLIANRTSLQDQVSTYVRDREYLTDPALISVCRRDVGLMVDSVANDLSSGVMARSIEYALAYWNGSTSRLPDSLTPNHKAKTIDSINQLRNYIKDLLVGHSYLSKTAGQIIATYPYTALCFTVCQGNPNVDSNYILQSDVTFGAPNTPKLFFVEIPPLVNNSNGLLNAYDIKLNYNLPLNLTNTRGIDFTNATVKFYARSTIETGSHTFEYMGTGTRIQYAIPAFGGKVNNNNEAVFDGLYDANAPGVVFYTSSNEVGDFKVGPNFKIVQSTGTIEGDIFQRSILTLVSPLMLVLE